MNIYDYIYLDLPKIISIYSQITGGVVEVLEKSTEYSRSSDNKRNYDFKVFKHDAGGTTTDKGTSRETLKPHHALLKETEELLEEGGYLVDLNDRNDHGSFKDPEFRAHLKNSFCIKVKGRAVIEDYERIKSIGIAFPEVVKLVNKSGESSLLESSHYAQIKEEIRLASAAIKAEKDRNVRAKMEQNLGHVKKEFAELVQSATLVAGVDQWILDGMRTWIDTFLSGIINLRIYPDIANPEEHVFGHLNKNFLEEKDVGSFHYTYGSFPTEELTLIGIVTSVPLEGGEQFKPLAEFDKKALVDYESVESGFRGLFRGFDGLEQIIRTCRFPRVLVYPLMVYREVGPSALVNFNKRANSFKEA
ncbi:hypothetical protein LL963_00185 [Xanthomonas campestris pv. esculenti]|nr:hypothetical protein [Xanthomonas campestris pv. esculenti]